MPFGWKHSKSVACILTEKRQLIAKKDKLNDKESLYVTIIWCFLILHLFSLMLHLKPQFLLGSSSIVCNCFQLQALSQKLIAKIWDRKKACIGEWLLKNMCFWVISKQHECFFLIQLNLCVWYCKSLMSVLWNAFLQMSFFCKPILVA